MIEAAIVECAYAGCDTIWVVCNDDISPLVRYRVGDFIEDPAYVSEKDSYISNTNRKRIPIFWVPIHPKDRDKRDCLSWAVIQGALSCLKVSSQLSKWTIPDKYYVSFPYGIFDPSCIKKNRKNIKTKNNFYISSNQKTVQDNYYCSFTFGKEDFIKYRRNIRKGTGQWSSEIVDSNGFPKKLIPISERWSARFFTLADVFNDLCFENCHVHNVDNFFNVDNWESYRRYISSDMAKTMTKPAKILSSYKEFNEIAKDREKK